MSYSALDKCGMMIYHLSVARLGPSEIRRIANKGYCNGYVTGVDTELGQTIMQARLAQEAYEAEQARLAQLWRAYAG